MEESWFAPTRHRWAAWDCNNAWAESGGKLNLAAAWAPMLGRAATARKLQELPLAHHAATPPAPHASCPQLTGCTKTKLKGWTNTQNTAGPQADLGINTYAITFRSGKAYLPIYAYSGMVIVCSDALTDCKKLYGCSGTSAPSTTNGGCSSAVGTSNMLTNPFRLEFVPAP